MKHIEPQHFDPFCFNELQIPQGNGNTPLLFIIEEESHSHEPTAIQRPSTWVSLSIWTVGALFLILLLFGLWLEAEDQEAHHHPDVLQLFQN
jgi:hypothetical protein